MDCGEGALLAVEHAAASTRRHFTRISTRELANRFRKNRPDPEIRVVDARLFMHIGLGRIMWSLVDRTVKAVSDVTVGTVIVLVHVALADRTRVRTRSLQSTTRTQQLRAAPTSTYRH
jgi:hypothetical protein